MATTVAGLALGGSKAVEALAPESSITGTLPPFCAGHETGAHEMKCVEPKSVKATMGSLIGTPKAERP